MEVKRADLLFEVVGGVLGFPEAASEAGTGEQRAVRLGIGLAFAFDGVFGDQFQVELAGAVFEQLLKGGADGGFVFDAKPGEFGEQS